MVRMRERERATATFDLIGGLVYVFMFFPLRKILECMEIVTSTRLILHLWRARSFRFTAASRCDDQTSGGVTERPTDIAVESEKEEKRWREREKERERKSLSCKLAPCIQEQTVGHRLKVATFAHLHN